MAKKLQLRPINSNLPYQDFADAVAYNISVLLDAYVHGANAMLFSGGPGKTGEIGIRGSSMISIAYEDFKAAFRIVDQSADPKEFYDNSEKLAEAITAILENINATETLFDKQSIINSIDDLVNGDLLLFDNGKLLSLWSTETHWYAALDFPVDMLTTHTGMSRIEIYELIDRINKANELSFSRTISVLAKQEGNNNSFYVPNLGFKDSPIHSNTTMDILVSSCLWTFLRSEAKQSEQHVFVVGSADYANEVFGKLSIFLDQDMYRSNETPASFLLQQRVAGSADNNTKFGLAIFDGNQIPGSVDEAEWTSEDKIYFEQFGHITKDGDKLWFSSHSKRRNGDSEDWRNGRMYLSKDMIEAWAANMHVHIAKRAILEAPWSTVRSTHYHEIYAPNVYLRRQEKFKLLGTDANGLIIDNYNLIVRNITEHVTGRISNENTYIKDLQNSTVSEFGVNNPSTELRNLRKTIDFAKLSRPVLNKFIIDSNGYFLLDPVSKDINDMSNTRTPGFYAQNRFVDTQLPSIFNSTFKSSTFDAIELFDVVNIGSNGVAIGIIDSDKTYTVAYFLEDIFPKYNSGSLDEKPYVTQYRRILDFGGMQNIKSITASKFGYVILCKTIDGKYCLLRSFSGKPNTWSLLPNSIFVSEDTQNILQNMVSIEDKLYIVFEKSIFEYNLLTGRVYNVNLFSDVGINEESKIKSFAIIGDDLLVHSDYLTQSYISRLMIEQKALVLLGGTDIELEQIIDTLRNDNKLCYAIASNETSNMQLIAIDYEDSMLSAECISILPDYITSTFVSGKMFLSTLKKTETIQVNDIDNDNLKTIHTANIISSGKINHSSTNVLVSMIDYELDEVVVIADIDPYVEFVSNTISMVSEAGTKFINVQSNTDWNILQDESAYVYIPDFIEMTDNITATDPWPEPEPDIIVVSANPISSISVKYGTALNTISLPAKVRVNLSNDTLAELSVTWDTGTPEYNKDVAGSYTFSGTLTMSGKILNTDGVKASVVINVAERIYNITSVTALSGKSVAYGTDSTALGLPQSVSVRLDDDSSRTLAITWGTSTPAYNKNIAGVYNFSGTLAISGNLTNTSNLKASISVTVLARIITITSITAIPTRNVVFGTRLSNLNLPSTVSAQLNTGGSVNLPVTWGASTPTYNGNTPGNYTFTGTVTPTGNITNPLNKTASATITVLEQQLVEFSVTGILTTYTVLAPYGTSRNNLDLPKSVDVSLNNGAATSLPVTWGASTPTYNGNTPGNYTFTGTISVSGTIINPDNITASVTVTVQKLKISSIELFNDKSVLYNTPVAGIGLPSKIYTVFEDNSNANLDIVWNTSGYNPTVAGNYDLVGTIALGSIYENPSSLTGNIRIIVEPKVTIVSTVSNVAVTVSYGTTKEQLNLSTALMVQLSDGTQPVLNLTWNYTTYKPTVAGTYSLPGTYILPENVYNTNNITATATVTVLPQVNLVSLSNLSNITVPYGTLISAITLPKTTVGLLDSGSAVTPRITWDTTPYNKDVAGTYTLVGTLEPSQNYTNTNNIKAAIKIIVQAKIVRYADFSVSTWECHQSGNTINVNVISNTSWTITKS